jgi:membrane associated rhomboid family serine protease
LIPYKDDNPTKTLPYVTYILISLNTAAFMFEILAGINRVVFSFGAVPASLVTFRSTQALHPALTVVTSMFLHGGIVHLAGNMLYLWIFADNIEDRLGHLRFLVFFLLCGYFAAYAHAVSDSSSLVPMIGASGAVSGILGAYLFLFPRAQVYTIVLLGFFVRVVRLPALIVIGFWAIIQFINVMLYSGTPGQGGVAWFAHIGGFLFGVFAIKLFLPKRRIS